VSVILYWFGFLFGIRSFSETGASVAVRYDCVTSAFVGLKSGSSDTSVTSEVADSPVSAWMRKNPYGRAST